MGKQRPPLGVGHPLKHFELHPVAGISFLCQHHPVGDVEEIVRSDADADGGQMIGLEAPLQHPLIVGIGFELAVIGGLRPVVEGRVDPLHLHIGPLHNADHDRHATGGHPFLRPSGDATLPRK